MGKKPSPAQIAKRINDAAQSDDASSITDASSIYVDYVIWTQRSKPRWHPVRKMRYVFFRMMSGATVTDALREIHWSPSEFWHLIDLKTQPLFDVEYRRAKTLQGRALADTVMTIADGRDPQTRRSLRRIRKRLDAYLLRAGKQKTIDGARGVIRAYLQQLDENDLKLVARNKIQIDAAKWLAKAVNPMEFSDRSAVALTGSLDGGRDPGSPFIVQFIGPDGAVVDPRGESS